MKTEQARILAISALSGVWEQDALAARLSFVYDDKSLKTDKIAKKIIREIDNGLIPNIDNITAVIFGSIAFKEYSLKRPSLERPRIQTSSPEMGDAPTFVSKPLPQIPTYNDLALWLKLSPNDLAWFADYEGWQRKVSAEKLHHYRYRWIKKSQGHPRLIEMPKPALKSIQRQILSEILDHVPPHSCVHGFTKGKSCMTHAQNHVGKDVVICMDFKDFFHSVQPSKISKLFYTLGYPWEVAKTLSALCVNTPSPYLMGQNFKRLPFDAQKVLLAKHMPQGAPTSPALANLCAWQLDTRLDGLAQKMGAVYSRYADDIAFSGGRDLKSSFLYLKEMVAMIAQDEGFKVNHRKTRMLTQGCRQSLVGVVVNEHPNIARPIYDDLKAVLYNCVRYGALSQNRAGHAYYQDYLRGKIAYVHSISKNKGDKLMDLYMQINWAVK